MLDAGVECVVAAPCRIPRGATDSVKADRGDAEHLVRLLLASQLTAVRIPGPEQEALRDHANGPSKPAPNRTRVSSPVIVSIAAACVDRDMDIDPTHVIVPVMAGPPH